VGGVAPGLNSKSSAENFSINEKPVEDAGSNDGLFAVNENPPEFNGGERAMEEFIKVHLKYPEASLRNNVTGRVVAEFTVDVDGSIKDIRILYSLDKYTDQEVIRVIKLMNGMWKPAEQNGKPVAARVVINNFVFRP
jgi:TonB family protein